MQDSSKVMAFAGAALLIVAIAGRVFRRETKTSAKLVSLGLSMMWASQGILLFGETCATETLPGATSVGVDGAPRLWPIEGFLAAGIHALQSVLLCVRFLAPSSAAFCDLFCFPSRTLHKTLGTIVHRF